MFVITRMLFQKKIKNNNILAFRNNLYVGLGIKLL